MLTGLQCSADDDLTYESLEPGDVIEVIAEGITFYHPPPYRETGVNPKGWEGYLIKCKVNWMDSITTADLPVMVQF